MASPVCVYNKKYIYSLPVKDIALHFVEVFAEPATGLEVDYSFMSRSMIGHFHDTVLEQRDGRPTVRNKTRRETRKPNKTCGCLKLPGVSICRTSIRDVIDIPFFRFD